MVFEVFLDAAMLIQFIHSLFWVQKNRQFLSTSVRTVNAASSHADDGSDVHEVARSETNDPADVRVVRPCMVPPWIPSYGSPFTHEGGQSVDEPPFDDVDDVGHRRFTFTLAPWREHGVAHDLKDGPCQVYVRQPKRPACARLAHPSRRPLRPSMMS